MQYRYLFFDLDGTLWDSREGITKAVRYALEQMGYESPALEDLYKFIGPPLTESFPEFYGMTMEQPTVMMLLEPWSDDLNRRR